MEKNLNDNQENGASSSVPKRHSTSITEKTTKTPAPPPQFQKPAEKEQKRMTKEDSPNSKAGQAQDQNQVEKLEEKSVTDLPPEMLTKMLEYLDLWSLSQCLDVNRQWEAISTGILASRPDNKISFTIDCECEKFVSCFQKRDGGLISNRMQIRGDHQIHGLPMFPLGETLRTFVKLVKQSQTCHFSHFKFYMSQSRDFDDKDFKKFLSVFSTLKFKSLSLQFNTPENMQELQSWLAKLQDILLKKIPHLEELQLKLGAPRGAFQADAAQVKLFPEKNQTQTPEQEESDKEIKSSAGTGTIQSQLPHLKSVHFKKRMISRYPEVCRDLLNAATNLTRIAAWMGKPEDLELLQSLGKIHLVKKAHIFLSPGFSPFIQNETNVALFPGLESLGLSNGLLSHVQLPTFKNLRILFIAPSDEGPIFPSGTSSRDIFPAVEESELQIKDWSSAFPQPDSIPVLPKARALRVVEGSKEGEEVDISKVALMCPNLSILSIQKANHGTPRLDFLKVSRSIWTHMKQLKVLQIDVDVGGPRHRPSILDSSFTGISPGNCLQLQKMERVRKAGGKNSSGIPDSKLEALTQREQPSILDMKDLKRLRINPYSKGKLLDKKDFWSNNLTWISQEYAFKLLPHLKLDK